MKYDTLKALVNAKVYENTEQRITGGDMNNVLQSAIASLGAHYQMGGLVSHTDNVTVGDEPVVFLATTPGTYTHFGRLVVADGEVALLVWSGTAWSKQTPDIATGTEVSQLGQDNMQIRFVEGGILNEFVQGAPNPSNPHIPISGGGSYSIRVTSFNNITYPGCKIKYHVPFGYYISIVSWDGVDISSYGNNDTGWISGDGTYTLPEKLFNVVARKSDSSNIVPSDVSGIKIVPLFNEDFVEEYFDDEPTPGSDKLLNSSAIYGNEHAVKLSVGSILNTFVQGATNENDYFKPASTTIRIVSLNNILFTGCKLKYKIQNGFSLGIQSWDGLDRSTYVDSGWFPDKEGYYIIPHRFVNFTIKRDNNGEIAPADAPELDLLVYNNVDEQPVGGSPNLINSGAVYIDNRQIKFLEGGILNDFIQGIVDSNHPYKQQDNPNTTRISSQHNIAYPGCKLQLNIPDSYNANVISWDGLNFSNAQDTGWLGPGKVDVTLTYHLFCITIRRANQGNITPSDVPEGFSVSLYQAPEKEKVLVNSKIFHTCQSAWLDKNNKYESWPFGSVMADGDTIVMIYNTRSAHVEKVDSDVLIRKKKTLADWHYKGTIIAHDSTYSYGNPVSCILPNGDYMVIVCCTNSSFVQDTHYFKMLKSQDKGETWTDLGFVQVGGENVEDECMMSLFCTSTGKLISFVGGLIHSSFIVSDDLGATWRYVGESTGLGTLEAGFYERSNGEIVSILRKNTSYPALIKFNAELTSYEIMYNFGSFNFPAYFNPTSISKMRNGELLLLGASRNTDSEGNYRLYEAVATDEQIMNNSILSYCILKYPVAFLADWGYAQTAVANDGNIYGYFYAGKVRGTTSIFEMFGC